MFTFRSSFSFTLFVIVAVFGTFASASAQEPQAYTPAPPLVSKKSANIRLASDLELTSLVAPAMASASRAADSGSRNQQPPLIAIDVDGDSYNQGVTASAINVGVVPSGSYFGAVSDNTRQFYVWYADSDIPAGYLWYNLENQRKLAFSEQGKVLEPKFIVLLPNGTVQQYTASKNFGVAGTPVKQTIMEGFAYNESGGSPSFVFYGNFGRAVGVLLHIPDSYTAVVPLSAITMYNGAFRIDGSKIENSFLPAGDYRVTIVDSKGYSDNGYTVRLMSNSNQNSNLKKRLQSLTEMTSR